MMGGAHERARVRAPPGAAARPLRAAVVGQARTARPPVPSLLRARVQAAAGRWCWPPSSRSGSRLPADEYARDIIPCVVRLFASNDRATRVQVRARGGGRV